MLKVVTTDEALNIIGEKINITKSAETVSLTQSLGRVLYEDAVSGENIPGFDRSTVDGFAVKASDTYGSSETSPGQLEIIGEILMGEKSEFEITDGQCVRISTGGMLPEGADSALMVEHSDSSLEPYCLCMKTVSPYENVTRKGDDVRAGDVLFRKGTVITSREIGVLASVGISKIQVSEKVRVGIISTGDEIVPIESESVFGKIRDVNSHILSALMRELGCEAKEYGIVPDNYESICKAIKKACDENDIVLISGGSSAGARDMTAAAIEKYGEVYLHGIAMKPGKPTIVGNIDGKAIFGLPGHPAAAYFVALRLVRPLIDSALCRKDSSRTLQGNLVQNISSNHGREEIVCVRLCGEGVEPVFGKSGIVSMLSQCDGYIIIPRNQEGLRAGDQVTIYLFER